MGYILGSLRRCTRFTHGPPRPPGPIPLLGGILFMLAGLYSAVVADPPQLPTITFSRDVAPILQANCQECHHPGGIGPFSLLTYQDARLQAQLIKNVTQRRIMPPWKAAAGYGEFRDVRRLTDDQIQAIARWVDAGTPEGDPRDLPPPRQFVDGSRLGTPDVVLDAGAPFHVRPDGPDFFWEFVLPFNASEDRWITAMEVLPGSPSVVHHVGIVVDPTGRSVALDRAYPGVGYPGPGVGFTPWMQLDFWTPGGNPHVLPSGTAWKIPARAYLVLDIHYSPDGQPHDDRTRLGLYFARGPIDRRVRFAHVGNTTFQIPPGVPRYRVNAALTLPLEITMLSLWPHMHWLRREAKAAATLPGGIARPLVWVPDYDFHWQMVYVFKEPVKLPQGSRIDLEAYYDNSAGNPDNPNRPPQTVGYGAQTRDEMCFLWFHYTVDREHLLQGIAVENDGIEERIN